MPPRPFPLPYSIGIDICHVARIRQILARTEFHHTKLQRFLRRFLSEREQEEFHARFRRTIGDDAQQYLDLSSKHLAGRWSAKEATIKAVTWRPLSFLDIHVGALPGGRGVGAVVLDEPAPSGDPGAAIGSLSGGEESRDGSLKAASGPDGSAEQQRRRPEDDDAVGTLDDLEGQMVLVNISHDADYATAVCLAMREAPR